MRWGGGGEEDETMRGEMKAAIVVRWRFVLAVGIEVQQMSAERELRGERAGLTRRRGLRRPDVARCARLGEDAQRGFER